MKLKLKLAKLFHQKEERLLFIYAEEVPEKSSIELSQRRGDAYSIIGIPLQNLAHSYIQKILSLRTALPLANSIRPRVLNSSDKYSD